MLVRKKRNYKTEGQFVPMMVYLKNNVGKEASFDGA